MSLLPKEQPLCRPCAICGEEWSGLGNAEYVLCPICRKKKYGDKLTQGDVLMLVLLSFYQSEPELSKSWNGSLNTLPNKYKATLFESIVYAPKPGEGEPIKKNWYEGEKE